MVVVGIDAWPWALWGHTTAAGLAVCAVALIGGVAYLIPTHRLRQLTPLGVSLSVGVLLGDAFLHLLPEALAKIGSVELVMTEALGGMLLFFVIEQIVRGRHRSHPAGSVMPLAPMNLLGDAVHNFIDGTLIAGSFLVSPTAGWATTVGLLIHELPQEVGDVGTLLYGGYSIRRAILYNLLSAMTCLLGIGFVLGLGLWLKAYTAYALPVAAGGFIYIAASDLIPELHRLTHAINPWAQLVGIAVGIGLMGLLRMTEPFF